MERRRRIHRRLFVEEMEQRVAPSAVAVFDNNSYVDTSSATPWAESDNVQATLATSLGHTVNTFTGITAPDFAAALSGADLLLIPEQEHGDLAPALSAEARDMISNYVNTGGGLIILGGYNTMNFLNAVFGFSVAIDSPGDSTLTGAADGTAFADGPATIPCLNAIVSLTTDSLPDGSAGIYVEGTNTTVALIPFGSGKIAFLGWDWHDAAPLGANDGGWVSVLGSAVTEVAGNGMTNTAPSIGGTTGDQVVDDNATIAPFSAVTITDPDSATVTVTVTMDDTAKGSFIALNGFADAGGGVYTYSGSPGDAQTAIRGMIYDPTDNRVTPASAETTTFTISVNDGISTVSDNAAAVISTSINDLPAVDAGTNQSGGEGDTLSFSGSNTSWISMGQLSYVVS